MDAPATSRSLLRGAGPLALVLLGACLPPPTPVDPDADVTDAAVPDATVVVEPATLTADEAPRMFGDVTVGGTSNPIEIVVINTGQQASGSLSVTLTGETDHFAIVPTGGADDCFGVILEPQASCKAQVAFAPDTAGAHAAQLAVAGDPGGMIEVDLTGNGLTPGDLDVTAGESLTFAPTELTLSTTAQNITVQNTGDTATAALTVTIVDDVNYSKSNDTCDGQPLGAGLSCSFAVTFRPTTVGSLPTQISIRESPNVGVAAMATGIGTANVAVTPTVGGTISSAGGELSCGATCGPVNFDQSPLMLTATAALGYEFAEWTGECAGTLGAVCSLVLDQRNSTVGATFTQLDCVPNVIDCNNATGIYTDCGPTGEIEMQMTCPLGCSTSSEQCVDVNPSNGLAAQLDLAASGPMVAFAGASTIDSDTGVVQNGAEGISVPTAVVGGIRVLRFKTLSIAGTLRVNGSLPVAFVVDGNVDVVGTLDVSANTTVAGPGARGAGAGACEGGDVPDYYAPAPGGGGAGHGQAGTAGGSNGGVPLRVGGPGGALSIDADLSPLVGGCTGGSTQKEVYPGSFVTTPGGGGGGAVQIVSRTRIRVTGAIDASGGGGHSTGVLPTGGSGGGSGGSVLLEAPQVILDGSTSVVSTKGGGGGGAGGNTGHPGADGGVDAAAAAGGVGEGRPAGGTGGIPSAFPGGGQAGSESMGKDAGGGGGGMGQARFNTTAGTINPQNGATIRSGSTTGQLGTRLVP